MRSFSSEFSRTKDEFSDTLLEHAFGSNVDYAMLAKLYGHDQRDTEATYSPAKVMSCHAVPISNPEPEHISTSYVERQNLTMRMSMRRFARITNTSCKKVEHHIAALPLYCMSYMDDNSCRIHQTSRVTPAMEAGITDHVWKIEEIVGLLGEKKITE